MFPNLRNTALIVVATTNGATIQVHMQGPFAITYVDPADDPSKKHPRGGCITDGVTLIPAAKSA